MAVNISPGVYSKVVDLSTYVQNVPGSTGFIASLSKKGEDNVLKFVGMRSELITDCGEPNISDYGKHYGQGLYCAYNFLGESGSLYHMRVLPEDATYSNIRINAVFDPTGADETATITIDYASSLNTKEEIITNLASSGTTNPICILYPIGRGEYYNGLGVRFIQHANPLYNGIYTLDIYEEQSDGDEVIIESFDVSFDPKAVDSTGDSIWITYVLENYSSILRCAMETTSDFTSGYNLVVKSYDQNIGVVSVEDGTSATITDTKQNFTDWAASDTDTKAEYVVIAKDSIGNKAYAWLGEIGSDTDTCTVFSDRAMTTRGWEADDDFDFADDSIEYFVKKSVNEISDAFISSTPIPFKNGSEGSLLTGTGSVDTTVADQILSNAYAGVIDDSILDTDNIYFNLVFDCGYSDNVKTAISTLVQTRRDCVAILDNGDNSTFSLAMDTRKNNHKFNNYFCALYEPYNKIYDSFTGNDVWVSPVYHMSYLIPRNDSVSEMWYATAGFDAASIDTIKDMRYNPKLGQRDQMYLKQLNPIVKFNPGYVVWGNLTSQAKASALQDLNIVRLVLYVKRALEQYCRYFIFKQNDSITWGEVGQQVVEFLEDIKNRRGLYDYSVDVSATAYEIKRKTFHVNVTLTPTRVVEKIELNFFIK